MSPAKTLSSVGYFKQRSYLKRPFYSDFRIMKKNQSKLEKVRRKLSFKEESDVKNPDFGMNGYGKKFADTPVKIHKLNFDGKENLERVMEEMTIDKI